MNSLHTKRWNKHFFVFLIPTDNTISLYRFADHISHMFGPDVPPASWDLDKKYKPEHLLVRLFIYW